jgi:hypothetical protein
MDPLLVGILYYIRHWRLADEEGEKLRDSAMKTKKGRSVIAVAAQITTIEVSYTDPASQKS